MSKNNDPVFTGIRDSRVQMKTLLAVFKSSRVLKEKECSWELFGKLQQGISLIKQALRLSESPAGIENLLEEEAAKPRKSYYKPKKKPVESHPAANSAKK